MSTVAGTVPHAWQACWSALGARGDGLALREALLAAWQSQGRHYHTRQHLVECLQLLDRHRDAAAAPAEVEMALWFHDAIYDPQAADNEAKSAHWAAAALHDAGVAPDVVARIVAHVLATRHDARPEGPDQALLVDIDLAILGAPPARYAEYRRQVRAEYAWVPEALFRERRAAVLARFLAREPLYLTPALRAEHEARARANLAAEVQALAAD